MTCLLFLPLYKNEAKISRIWVLPSYAFDIIWRQRLSKDQEVAHRVEHPEHPPEPILTSAQLSAAVLEFSPGCVAEIRLCVSLGKSLSVVCAYVQTAFQNTRTSWSLLVVWS